jgi:2-hydroxy-3-keto-5-methylthiopentenyl-1-phosphate phosphatase
MRRRVIEAPLEILCDFDGTIASIDTVDFLLERLADPGWRILEEQWIRGEIDSSACMTAQIALVRGGWRAIRRALEEVRLDPGFARFASWCRASRIPLRVVSEGIEQVIIHLLRREAVLVDEVWAPRLSERSNETLELRLPAPGSALCGAALCKCVFVTTAASPPFRVLIGDGRSDFCISRRADLVFACSKLAIHCEQNDIPFVPFVGFDTVRRLLEKRHAPFPRVVEPEGTLS